jgi:hypothetical protein
VEGPLHTRNQELTSALSAAWDDFGKPRAEGPTRSESSDALGCEPKRVTTGRRARGTKAEEAGEIVVAPESVDESRGSIRLVSG